MKIKLITFILMTIISFPVMAQDIFTLDEKGDLEAIKRMVSEDTEILNKKNRWNQSLIFAASRYNQIEIVKYLIKNGADVNSKNPFGRTPLVNSANKGNMKMAEILLAAGSDINYKGYRRESIGFRAVIKGFTNYLEFCINNGLNINNRDGIGNSLLAKAALYAKPEVIKYLIEKRMDVNAVNDYGQSGLHIAAIRGYTNVIRLLIDAGANVNLKDRESNTPLFYTGKYGHKNAYDLLLQESNGNKKVKTNFEFSELLKTELAEGEAYIWYLIHSGWAVKTKNHLLIFDYIPNPSFVDHIAENPLLSNGHINTDELKDLQVTFFISHSHGDHFSKKILEFEKEIKNISYIFGWQAFNNAKYTYMTKNKEQININGLKIESLLTKDPGSGFIVKADGVSMFFFGDFNVAGDLEETTRYISEKYKNIDLSFVLGLGGPMHISDYYINNVNSNVIFPIHGGNYEYLLKEYANKMKDKTQAVFCCPENRGDMFFYSKGKIR